MYGAVELGGVDCLEAFERLDATLGTSIEPHIRKNVNPKLGNLAVVAAVNEALDVVRIPIVVATTPAVVNAARRFLFRK